ncbi:MAG TPA: hypothetical protein ENJ18_12590 [Nannocystis exedens]|nr:hypothetical protein [Nannocystis exedens]
MSRRSLPLALSLLLLGAHGCASKTEQASRDAWSSALQNDREERGDGPGRGKAGQAEVEAESQRSWGGLSQKLDDLAEQLATGISTVDFSDLAADLCGQETEANRDDGRRVYHCVPTTAISLGGESLEIELDDSGVIAFVAANTNDATSTTLLQQALLRLAKLCSETWTGVPADAENAHREFYSCPMESGPVIAIGRFPRDLATDQWHFSLVVLGPG